MKAFAFLLICGFTLLVINGRVDAGWDFPEARSVHSVIWNPVGTTMIIHGGNIVSGRSNETWAWDLNRGQWIKYETSGDPGVRGGHVAIFDEPEGTMVIFGGKHDTPPLNDTWVLNLGTLQWSQPTTSGSPAARDGHCAVYDPIGHRMIMWGGRLADGYDRNAYALALDGTWAWSVFSSSFPGDTRMWASCAYDLSRRRMIVFGGVRDTTMNDCWALDLTTTTWDQLGETSPDKPPTGSYTSSIYDPLRDRLIVFGGTSGSTDVWALDLSTELWGRIQPCPQNYVPAARRGHSAVYDPERDAMVVFGGEYPPNRYNDVWLFSFEDEEWYLISEGKAFTNVEPILGVGEPDYITQGMAWGDFNNDGWPDLFVSNHGEGGASVWSRLYRNDTALAGRFTDVTQQMGIIQSKRGMGCAWADFDNDGDLDLYVIDWEPSVCKRLYRNDGDHFTDVAPELGVADCARHGNNCAWADFNLDGWVDLFVANDDTCRLYMNTGTGFQDVAAQAGVNIRGRSVAWGDYDNDGDPDLYVGTYSGSDHLYRNNLCETQQLQFTDVTSLLEETPTGITNGVAWADYDNDSDLDLYVCMADQLDFLFHNDGSTFTKVVRLAGGTAKNACTWGDYDLDGDLDLYITRAPAGLTNLLYRNDGTSFAEVGEALGVADSRYSVPAGWCDYDLDGDIDLFVGNGFRDCYGNPLYRNEIGDGNHWLIIKLSGNPSNGAAIGAKVTAYAGTSRQMRVVEGGSGYSSQNSQDIHFGFGPSVTEIDSIVVAWPGWTGCVNPGPANAETTLSHVSVDQVLEVTQRGNRQWHVPGDFPTIQACLDACLPGDTVCVSPARYVEHLEIEDFDSLFVLGSCSCGAGTGSVIIDPDTSAAAVRFNNVGPGVRFEGFVLTGGTCGMSLYDSDPQIRNVIIYGNENGIELSNSSPALVNSVVADNDIYGIYLSGSSCPVLNGNIVSGNFRGIYGATACCVDAHYNDVWGNTINFGGACSGHWPPDQNISQDPKYANSSMGDYHLCVDSPCIDRGDPDSSKCDPDGSRNDMGAYGGPQACQDYPSYAKGVKAVAESTVVGLTWEGNAAPESVSYYIVYRDTALGFVPDATKHYRDVYGTSLADTIGLNARYAYRIAAVDNHCYQGGYSVSIQAETCPLREGVLTASYSWGCPVENSIRGNVVAEGVGLRGTGTGSIVLTGIPAQAQVVRALLYWDRSPYASLNGVRVGATTVGRDHGVSGYRADVAHIVSGNGTYVVSVDGASDGASLAVVYEDSTMARRAITINDGLDNEGPGSGGVFDNTYFAYDQQDSVYACYIVGGGSPGLSEKYYYNSQMVAADSANASDGSLWDTDWVSIHPYIATPPPGQSGASAHIVEITDSLNWVAAINVGLLLPAGVSDRNDAAKHAWALAPIHPNPSGSRMVVEFDVPKDGGKISLVVYDVAGRLVRTLIDGSVSAGRHSVDWDATRDQGMQVSPGIYFIHMEAGSYQATKKVVMLD